MQIFIAMDYSILMPENYVHFRKGQKHLAKTFPPFPPPPVEVTGSMYFGNTFRIMYFSVFSKICTKT